MELKAFAEKLFSQHPFRFTKTEKLAMHTTVKSALVEAGWKENEIRVQQFKGAFKSRNVIIGDPGSAEYFITAHYDTPGCNGFMLGTSPLLGQTGANIVLCLLCFPLFFAVGIIGTAAGKLAATGTTSVPLPNIILGILVGLLAVLLLVLPMAVKNKNNRNDNTSGVLGVLYCAARIVSDPDLKKKCCFILFDNEEWGVIGSMQFAKWCKKNGIDTDKTTVINLDCIGVGDTLVAARTGACSDMQRALIEKLGAVGLDIVEKQSSMVFLSDHANFKNSYMLCYMKKSKLGPLYIPNIHTSKDIECDVDMVEGLAEKIIEAINRE